MFDDNKVISYIEQHEGCKFKQIQNGLRINERNFRILDYSLQRLKKSNKIHFVRGKNSGWYITNNQIIKR